MFESLIKMWHRKLSADEDALTFTMPLLVFSPGPFLLYMALLPGAVESQFMRELIMDFRLLLLGWGSIHALVFAALVAALIAALRKPAQ